MHVRRGDVIDPASCDANSTYYQERRCRNGLHRFTPDEVYFDLIARLRKKLVGASFQVFAIGAAAEFESWRDKGVELVLNGDILEDWKSMAQADVFVTAASSFSFLPALLNTRCVIFQPLCLPALRGWIDTNLTGFDRCLARVVNSKGP